MPKDWDGKPACAPRRFDYAGTYEIGVGPEEITPRIEAYTDGACRITNPGLASCAFVVYIDGKEHHSGKFFLGDRVTNNVAEYMGLINLLEWADANQISGMTIRSDSQLVVNHVNGRWNVKPELKNYCVKAFGLLRKGSHTLVWVRGHNGEVGNERVDALCNEILDEIQKTRSGNGEKSN